MLDISKHSKEELYNLMVGMATSFNYGFIMLESWLKQHHPEEYESDEVRKIFEDMAAFEAKKISRTLKPAASPVDNLINLLNSSHWAMFEHIEVVKAAENVVRFRILGCSFQEALKKRGEGFYDCRVTGTLLRRGFFDGSGHNVTVQRVFTPPDAAPAGMPANVSCEWLITLEGHAA